MTTNDKIIKRNVQTTVGATEDLQVAIELHLGLPPDGASITVYMTEEQAWDHRASVYEALKDIKDERRRRGGMTPIATLEGPALLRAQDVVPMESRDEHLIELGAWREASRSLGFKSPGDLTATVTAIRAMVDDERKATMHDRARLGMLETLLVKATAWRAWDGSKTSEVTGVPDPQDDLEACINTIAPLPDDAVICPDCQRDPDPRGWTACVACRRLNGWL